MRSTMYILMASAAILAASPAFATTQKTPCPAGSIEGTGSAAFTVKEGNMSANQCVMQNTGSNGGAGGDGGNGGAGGAGGTSNAGAVAGAAANAVSGSTSGAISGTIGSGNSSIGDVAGGAGGAVKDSGNSAVLASGNSSNDIKNSATGGAGGQGGIGLGGTSVAATGPVDASSSNANINGASANGNGSGNKLNNDSTSVSGSNSGGNVLAGSQDVKLGVESNLIGGDTTVTGGDQKINADQRNNVDASSANSNKQNTSQTNAGNNSKSTQTNAGNNSSNAAQGNTTSVDASDRSVTNYSSKTLFIPPVVPATPPSQVAIGNIIKETLACGPLQTVVKTPIVGTRSGLIGKSKVDQGFTYDLAPYTDANGNILDYREVPLADGSGYRLFGSQVVMFSTVIGISGGGNLAIGGGGGNQSWGQGGFGTSSSNTRLVTNIQVAQCEVGTVKYVPVEREVPVKPKGQ